MKYTVCIRTRILKALRESNYSATEVITNTLNYILEQEGHKAKVSIIDTRKILKHMVNEGTVKRVEKSNKASTKNKYWCLADILKKK